MAKKTCGFIKMSNLKILLFIVPVAILAYLLYKHLNKKFYIEGLDSTPPATSATPKTPATTPANTDVGHLVQFDLTLDPDSKPAKVINPPIPPTPPTPPPSPKKPKPAATPKACSATLNDKAACRANIKCVFNQIHRGAPWTCKPKSCDGMNKEDCRANSNCVFNQTHRGAPWTCKRKPCTGMNKEDCRADDYCVFNQVHRGAPWTCKSNPKIS